MLMEEIPNNHLGCIKPCVNNGTNYQPEAVSRISEPSTGWDKWITSNDKCCWDGQATSSGSLGSDIVHIPMQKGSSINKTNKQVVQKPFKTAPQHNICSFQNHFYTPWEKTTNSLHPKKSGLGDDQLFGAKGLFSMGLCLWVIGILLGWSRKLRSIGISPTYKWGILGFENNHWFPTLIPALPTGHPNVNS